MYDSPHTVYDASGDKFTGKKRDAESGLDYFGAGYYGSNIGRWMSADPLGGSIADPQSLNRFAYVLNSPTNFIDPLGLHPDPSDQDILLPEMSHTGCTLDGAPISCSVAASFARLGAAGVCPNNDCSGIRLNQGSGGTSVFRQWQVSSRTGMYVNGVYDPNAGGWTISAGWRVVGVLMPSEFLFEPGSIAHNSFNAPNAARTYSGASKIANAALVGSAAVPGAFAAANAAPVVTTISREAVVQEVATGLANGITPGTVSYSTFWESIGVGIGEVVNDLEAIKRTFYDLTH